MANDRAAIAKRPGPFPTPAFQAAQAPDPRCTCFARPKIRAKRNAMSTKLAQSIVCGPHQSRSDLMLTSIRGLFVQRALDLRQPQVSKMEICNEYSGRRRRKFQASNVWAK